MIKRILMIAAISIFGITHAEPLPAIQVPVKAASTSTAKVENSAPTNSLAPIKTTPPMVPVGTPTAPKPFAGGPVSASPKIFDDSTADKVNPQAVGGEGNTNGRLGAAQTGKVSGVKPQQVGGVIPGTGNANVQTAPKKAKATSKNEGAKLPTAANDPINLPDIGQNNATASPRTHVVEEQVAVPGTSAHLPGIEPRLAKAIVIQTQVGINEVVKVSNKHPNRLVVPFSEPEVVDLSNLDYKTSGNAIYVYPSGSEPIGIFVQDKRRPNVGAISLTLVPQDIPGQTITFTLDSAAAGNVEEKKSNEYVDTIKYIMRSAAKGTVPDGCNDTQMVGPKSQMGPITATPKRRLGCALQDLYIYDLKDAANQRVTLSEQSFYKEGVLAVSFFPRIQLDPGQMTKVFILVKKSDGESAE